MSTTEVIFDSTRHVIEIKTMTISNPDVFLFLKDKENPSEWVERALIVGCIGLKQMIITENIDFVEKEVNRLLNETKDIFKKIDVKNTDSPFYQMREFILEYFEPEKGKFKKILDEYFNKDRGQIKNIIDQTFDLNNKNSAFSSLIEEIKNNSGIDRQRIEDLLNPTKQDSPVKHLKEEIFEKIKDVQEKDLKDIEKSVSDIRETLVVKSAVDEEKQKGTQKGREFENIVYEALETIAAPYEDNITHVGHIKGVTNDKGDIIVDIQGDERKRIVIECKDASNYSVKKVKDEIFDAINNRKSKFCIFLFARKDQVPTEYLPVKITENYIVTSMDNENLHLCYRLARILLKDTKKDDEIDLNRLSGEINKIEQLSKNIDNLRSEVKKILNSANYLEDNLATLYRHIDQSVDNIRLILGDKYTKKKVPIEDSIFIRKQKNKENPSKKVSNFPDWMEEK